MALTQTFPRFEASWECFGEERAVPRVARAREEDFRSGADLGAVIDTICNNRNVAVNAAPGAGKSTVLPVQLAKRVDRLVLHVLPYPALAAVLHDYVVSSGICREAVLVDAVAQPWPASGLCITSAGQLVARWLQDGRAELDGAYVLHDESHESGAASGVMRALLRSMRGVLCYVTMTATSGVGLARAMETKGSVEDREYDPVSFVDPWSVEEDGAPWAAYGLDGNILLFEDDKKRAADLVQAYNYHGVQAFRVHSGTAPRDIVNMLARMHDTTVPALYAVVADSTFRSGYTFPVSTVVDSGVVRRVVAVDGKPRLHSRGIYESERVQARARGGRMPGQRSVYWRPVGDVANLVCDLEQPDVEAAALIFRVLGYRVPAEMASATMASGPVPRDLCAALRGAVPLSCIAQDSLFVPERHDSRAVSSEDSETEERLVARPPVAVAAAKHERKDSALGARSADVLEGESPEDVLADLLSGLGRAPEPISLGQYCVVTGVAVPDVVSVSFPRGAESVWRVLGRDPTHAVTGSWSVQDRSVAVNALVSAYNVDVVQWRAWARVLQEARAAGAACDQVALRTWLQRCAEEVARLGSRAETGLRAFLDLAEGYFEVEPSHNLLEREEARYAASLVEVFHRVPRKSLERSGQERARVRGWVDGVVGGMEADHTLRRGGGLLGVDLAASGPSWYTPTTGYTGHARPRVPGRVGGVEVTRVGSDRGLALLRRRS